MNKIDKYIGMIIWLLSLTFSMGIAWNQISANKANSDLELRMLYEINERLSRIEGKIEAAH